MTTQPSSHSRLAVQIIVALTLFGGALRFYDLDSRDFWLDESCTFIYVHNLFDWPEESSLLVESTNLPYYFLLRGWSKLWGTSKASYRAMSALAATLTIPLLALIGWRYGGPKVGVVAALLCALHPLNFYYAHEARAYALWLLLLTLALWLLYEAVVRSKLSWWVGYVVTAVVCVHLHYFSIFFLAATVCMAWLVDRRSRALRHIVIANVVVVIAFVPYVVAAVLPAAGGGGSAWIKGTWDPVLAIPETLWAIMPAGNYPPHLRGLSLGAPDTQAVVPAWLSRAAKTFAPALIVGCTVIALRQSRLRKLAILMGLTLVPLFGAWLYSLAVRPIYLSGRYDLVALPAGILLMAAVICHAVEVVAPRRRRAVLAGMCVALGACSAVPLSRMAAQSHQISFSRLRSERLATIARAHDLVVAFSYDKDQMAYDLHKAGFQGAVESFPSWLDGQVGWVDYAADRATIADGRLAKDARTLADAIASRIAEGHRAFVLYDNLEIVSPGARSDVNDHLLTALRARGLRPYMVDEQAYILEMR